MKLLVVRKSKIPLIVPMPPIIPIPTTIAKTVITSIGPTGPLIHSTVITIAIATHDRKIGPRINHIPIRTIGLFALSAAFRYVSLSE
jgi:hypothetical protein